MDHITYDVLQVVFKNLEKLLQSPPSVAVATKRQQDPTRKTSK